MKNKQITAFFDLDHTLIKGNSILSFAFFDYRCGYIPIRLILRSLIWNLSYRLGYLNREAAFQKAASFYQGREVIKLKAHVAHWFEKQMVNKLLNDANKTIEKHRQQGHRLVLLTSSPSFIAACAAAAWGFDDWIANIILQDENGKLISCIERPICYKSGKIKRAEIWAKQHNVDLSSAFYYGDSYADIPILNHIGNPHAVNPDRQLCKVAKKKQWPILKWE